MAEKFDDALLEQYINTFYGYGNPAGHYWFVGMEEGGGSDFGDVQRRLEVWHQHGKKQFEDLAVYHQALAVAAKNAGFDDKYCRGYTRLFDDPPKLQRTWGKLIQILLSIKGQSITPDLVRAYQQQQLGKENDETCLPELLPLPSRSLKDWLYKDHSQLDYLVDRRQYGQHCAEMRVNGLRQLVETHQPAVVVFYSLHSWYKPRWEQIAGLAFEMHQIENRDFLIGQNQKTVFAITTHPAAKGITNSYFQQVGKSIRHKLNI